MERSRQELEKEVSSQKEQLTRYEKRLKDVVTAYKGLLKEKEALESSLAAFTKEAKPGEEKAARTTATEADASPASNTNSVETRDEAPSDSKSNDQLQTQIITLMNSLATLSAEKSRMEASFQADKKQLRQQLAHKDQKLAEMQQRLKESDERAKAGVDEMKAKWIVERQEREQETNNQMLMIRELQKLYSDERHLKENIEMQLNNLKAQFADTDTESLRLQQLQKQLSEARDQLKQFQEKNQSEKSSNAEDNVALIKQVQQEMQQLKEQHAVAIKQEQRRVLQAEEQSRKQAALHEDRVANLEARLAELSDTVGSYDRLRAQDQDNIQGLKKKLHELELQADSSKPMASVVDNVQRRRSNVLANDISGIVDEIMRLKKLLISENQRSSSPIDIHKIFSVGTDHVGCQEEMNRLQLQVEAAQASVNQLHEKIQVQKTHIVTLQEKVKVLNRNIDEQELELKHSEEKLRQAVHEERAKWKAAIAELENEHRCKVNDIEQQLQNQRQRSLQLLDEKEHEIKTLQTSFEVFHNTVTFPAMAAAASGEEASHNSSADPNASTSDAESSDGKTPATGNSRIQPKKMSIGDNCHMLHYANEIARKDIEIAGLRKSKYAAETALRKAIHDKVTAQEDLSDKIAMLEEQVDRLERCKTREGANLEYLKNVMISFIVTRDADGKQHMLKAISSVLQFTPGEIQAINAAFHKK